MLTLAASRSEGLPRFARYDDDDGPDTLERYISVGEPMIVAKEICGAEAAVAALTELAAADAQRALDEEDPPTREFVVPKLARGDFDPSLLDALAALELGDDLTARADLTASGGLTARATRDLVEDPYVEASIISFDDLRVMERLLEPYVDFASLASL